MGVSHFEDKCCFDINQESCNLLQKNVINKFAQYMKYIKNIYDYIYKIDIL